VVNAVMHGCNTGSEYIAADVGMVPLAS